ncbi:MAG: STAS domain-containing protein [Pseudomonadota bacterium]
MEIDVKTVEKGIVLSVKGRMDAVSSPDFEKRLEELIGTGPTCFVIDLNDLEYISSAGLRTILASAKKLKGKEGRLILARLKDVVKEVFEISGFSTIIPICDSVESALDQC